jgi:hypothetical protein
MRFIYNVFFVVIVFCAWLSIIFNIVGKVWNEEIFFETTKRAVLLYLVSMLISTILTVLSFGCYIYIVCK